jgi:hypothetical protein
MGIDPVLQDAYCMALALRHMGYAADAIRVSQQGDEVSLVCSEYFEESMIDGQPVAILRGPYLAVKVGPAPPELWDRWLEAVSAWAHYDFAKRRSILRDFHARFDIERLKKNMVQKGIYPPLSTIESFLGMEGEC